MVSIPAVRVRYISMVKQIKEDSESFNSRIAGKMHPQTNKNKHFLDNPFQFPHRG